MKNRTLAVALGVMLAFASLAGAQTWTALTNAPSFSPSTALLLTDGTIMVQATENNAWWRLTPDNTGSYINGTWSALASMSSSYGPLYYGSAVLADGRVVVQGGEYNFSGSPVWTAQGAIYDPAANTWTSITPPATWPNIGDAQSVVLANGTFMLANPFTAESALLNASTLTWTLTGASSKADNNDEEGWTLLPSGKVLTVDANNPPDLTHSELYDPATGTWSSAGSTIVKLPDTNSDGSGSREIGPAVLRPNGTVFATGGTSNTSVYNPSLGTWTAGPTFPTGIDVADGPAALLPNGNVLVDAGPGIFGIGAVFYEFNGTTLTSVSAPPRAPFEPSFAGRMLVLPTGQILFTDGSTDVEVYTPTGTYSSAWQPTITSFPGSVPVGSVNNSISGTQFNGLSQGAAYGDDAQMATNYPLVRITNSATGHVFYAKTHSHSTMAVATGTATVSTQFDVPTSVELGTSTLQVVANGIPSAAVTVTIAPNVPYDKVGTAKLPSQKSEFRLSATNARGASQTTVRITGSGGIIGIPVSGDWNGDGVDTVGNFDQSTATFYLRNTNSIGSADLTFVFGTGGAGWLPIAGDWNGDHVDTIGVYNPSTQTFYLRNTNSAGLPDITFTFTGASSTWLPIAGDWNGDGITTVGLYDPATNTFYLRNSNTTGGADLTFVFGTGSGLLPVAGDWDGDGVTTIGVYDSTGTAAGTFKLRNHNSAGTPDIQFVDGFLSGGAAPVSGKW
jgi:hypothetical protein